MGLNEEVGRQLRVDELVMRTVVLVAKVGRPYMATMWVMQITPPYVEFYAGATNTHFLAEGRDDGTLCDDTGAEIKVFEYLGEI